MRTPTKKQQEQIERMHKIVDSYQRTELQIKLCQCGHEKCYHSEGIKGCYEIESKTKFIKRNIYCNCRFYVAR